MNLREQAQMAAEDAGYGEESIGFTIYRDGYLAGHQDGAAAAREIVAKWFEDIRQVDGSGKDIAAAIRAISLEGKV